MKNLYTYINPAGKFTNPDWGDEPDKLVKIQIDNSLELGWKREDIVLVTNFPYEYNGVKAVVVSTDNYCAHSSGTPSKINVILTLYDMGIINDIFWFHDFDAFQLQPITVEELGLIPGGIALTDYGFRRSRAVRLYLNRWSTGTVFFDPGSRDVFEWIKIAVYKYMANEEVSLLALTRHNKHGINSRIKKLNLTYNLATRRRDIKLCYEICDKPLKVIHFHPSDPRLTSLMRTNMDVCFYGKSELGNSLMSDGLRNLFTKHGIK